MYYIHVLHTAPYSCQPDRLATLRFSASSVVWDSWDSGHCSLSICDYRLSWTNTVSEQKIPITILILKRGPCLRVPSLGCSFPLQCFNFPGGPKPSIHCGSFGLFFINIWWMPYNSLNQNYTFTKVFQPRQNRKMLTIGVWGRSVFPMQLVGRLRI